MNIYTKISRVPLNSKTYSNYCYSHVASTSHGNLHLQHGNICNKTGYWWPNSLALDCF